jgi:hypothetical protein
MQHPKVNKVSVHLRDVGSETRDEFSYLNLLDTAHVTIRRWQVMAQSLIRGSNTHYPVMSWAFKQLETPPYKDTGDVGLTALTVIFLISF